MAALEGGSLIVSFKIEIDFLGGFGFINGSIPYFFSAGISGCINQRIKYVVGNCLPLPFTVFIVSEMLIGFGVVKFIGNCWNL